MNIIFLGYAVNEDYGKNLSGISIAGNKMQLSLLRNLKRYNDISSITVLPIDSFPNEKRVFVKKETVDIDIDTKSKVIPFINIPILKQITQTLAVYLRARKLIKQDTLVFTFNLFPQVGIPMILLKKFHKVKTVSMIADLPIDDATSRHILSRSFRYIFDLLTRIAIKNVDKIIALNENAIRIFASTSKYIIIEGGINYNELIEPSLFNRNNKNIIYSGSLTKYSGIENLINAFKLPKIQQEDIELHIYGSGELSSFVEEEVKKNGNIKFMGRVNNDRMKEIQRESFLLVNPRPVNDKISNVTFPSKVFEYMSSGTPVLTTKLSGITEEYKGKVFLIDDNSPNTIADKIVQICSFSKDDLEVMTKDAFKFIRMYKTWEFQVEKIQEFLERD